MGTQNLLLLEPHLTPPAFLETDKSHTSGVRCTSMCMWKMQETEGQQVGKSTETLESPKPSGNPRTSLHNRRFLERLIFS